MLSPLLRLNHYIDNLPLAIHLIIITVHVKLLAQNFDILEASLFDTVKNNAPW